MDLLKRLTYKNLMLNKKRSIVTIVGIVLSVALLTAVCSMAVSLYNSMVVSEKQTKGDYHYKFSNMNAEYIDIVKNNQYVEEVNVITNQGYAVIEGSKNNYKPYARVIGVDKASYDKLSLNLIEGRMPENEDEIVIPRHLKTNGRVDLKVGDTITLEIGDRYSLGKEELPENSEETEGLFEDFEEPQLLDTTTPFMAIDLEDGTVFPLEKIVPKKTKTYKVVGKIERPGYGIEEYTSAGYTFVTYNDLAKDDLNKYGNDLIVYARYSSKGLRNRYDITADILGVDRELYKKVYGNMDQVSSMSREEAEDCFKELDKQLQDRNIIHEENYWLIRYECLFPINSELKVLGGCVLVVSLVIIFTSVFCINNSFSISISEKTKQYGMLASIGATRKQIKKSVLYEAFLLGVAGIPLGIMCGLFASFILVIVCNKLIVEALTVNLVFHFSIISILFAIILGVITIYLSAMSSARKASKISPITAIRNQEDIKIKNKKLKTPKWIGKLWGVGGVVSYKNIKRNRRKYRTAVVSIAVCTITYIVVSYFVSLGFYLVKLSYGEVDYNIQITTSTDGKKSEELLNEVSRLDGIDRFNKIAYSSMGCNNIKMSEKYSEYMNLMGIDDPEQYVMVEVVVMEGQAYKDYLEEVGISESAAKEKGILVNKTVQDIYDEASEKSIKTEMDIFDAKAGDVMTAFINDYTNAEYDENGDEIVPPEEIPFDIELAAVTDKRPFGFADTLHNDFAYLIINRDYWNALDIEAKDVNGVVNRMFIETKQADKLQDDIDKLANELGNDDYYLSNRDADAKIVKNLITLLAIFAYGFITVIALIGITSIINTISTSMELRSREFATLRSIGMTSREFNRMIRLESIFTGGKALAFGVPIGLVLSYLVYKITMQENYFEFVWPIKSVIVCVIVVFLLLLGIMKFSVSKINSKNIIETIKNENI